LLTREGCQSTHLPAGGRLPESWSPEKAAERGTTLRRRLWNRQEEAELEVRRSAATDERQGKHV